MDKPTISIISTIYFLTISLLLLTACRSSRVEVVSGFDLAKANKIYLACMTLDQEETFHYPFKHAIKDYLNTLEVDDELIISTPVSAPAPSLCAKLRLENSPKTSGEILLMLLYGRTGWGLPDSGSCFHIVWTFPTECYYFIYDVKTGSLLARGYYDKGLSYIESSHACFIRYSLKPLRSPLLKQTNDATSKTFIKFRNGQE